MLKLLLRLISVSFVGKLAHGGICFSSCETGCRHASIFRSLLGLNEGGLVLVTRFYRMSSQFTMAAFCTFESRVVVTQRRSDCQALFARLLIDDVLLGLQGLVLSCWPA